MQTLNDWFNDHYVPSGSGYVVRRPKPNITPAMTLGFAGRDAGRKVKPRTAAPQPVVAQYIPPPPNYKAVRDMDDAEVARHDHWEDAPARGAAHKEALAKTENAEWKQRHAQRDAATLKLVDRQKEAASSRALDEVADAEREAEEALEHAARKQAILERLKGAQS